MNEGVMLKAWQTLKQQKRDYEEQVNIQLKKGELYCIINVFCEADYIYGLSKREKLVLEKLEELIK